MGSNLFVKSKLSKLVLQEISCKKLETPSKKSELKVSISVGLAFDDKKTKDGYNILYNIDIKCEEDGEEKLFIFKCQIKAVYQIKDTKSKISERFKASYNLFLREMYNISREEINLILHKMNVSFQLPFSLPDELKIKMEKTE